MSESQHTELALASLLFLLIRFAVAAAAWHLDGCLNGRERRKLLVAMSCLPLLLLHAFCIHMCVAIPPLTDFFPLVAIVHILC